MWHKLHAGSSKLQPSAEQYHINMLLLSCHWCMMHPLATRSKSGHWICVESDKMCTTVSHCSVSCTCGSYPVVHFEPLFQPLLWACLASRNYPFSPAAHTVCRVSPETLDVSHLTAKVASLVKNSGCGFAICVQLADTWSSDKWLPTVVVEGAFTMSLFFLSFSLGHFELHA